MPAEDGGAGQKRRGSDALIPAPRRDVVRRIIVSRLEKRERPAVDLRVGAHPVLPTRETRRVVFAFEGRPIEAREGESVAAALLAAGVSTLGRSFKFHRPRGILCGSGWCATCSMRVDGLPGVLTCVTPVRQGMVVERDRPWQTGERDALRALELAGPLTKGGFYYRHFTEGRRAYRVWERLLANLAAAGRLPDGEAARRLLSSGVQSRDVDVCVVGGGAAGMAAALAAARAGRATLLVERDLEFGGGLLVETRTLAELDWPVPSASRGGQTGVADHAASAGESWSSLSAVEALRPLVGQASPEERAFTLAQRLAAAAAAQDGLEILIGATAQVWGDEDVLLVETASAPVLVTARSLVVATGTRDRRVAFPGGDLPGVMLARGVQRLLHRDRVRPGKRATVVTDGATGYAVARQLLDAGVEIAAFADVRPLEEVGGPSLPAGVRALPGFAVEAAHGFGRLRGVSLVSVGSGKRASDNGGTVRVESDTLCLALSGEPADELVAQVLAHGSHNLGRVPLRPQEAAAPGALRIDTVSGRPGLWVAGTLTGVRSLGGVVAQGMRAGEEAAAASLLPA